MADSGINIASPSGTADVRTESTNGDFRQVIVIGDPSANTSVAAVKAASTAAVATDPSLVVTVSPNSFGYSAQRTTVGTMSNGFTQVGWPSDNALPAGTNTLGTVGVSGTEYETVAASQTAQALGATGATGDLINGVLVIPATTSPGNVLLLDNATSITVFAGGASSVSNLVPFFIPLGIRSVSGAWKITTGANVSCIGVGDFT